MASTSFAGSTIETTAGYPSFVTVTLPSGKQIPNINGWGPNQYNSYATTLSPADAESLNSIQASADIIISGLQNQDQQAKTTTSSLTDTSAGTSPATGTGTSTTTPSNNTTVTNSTSSGVDPQTGLSTTGAGSATEIGSAYGYTAPASVDNGSDPYVSNGISTIPSSTPTSQSTLDNGSDPYVSNGISTIASASANSASNLTESQQLALAAGSSTAVPGAGYGVSANSSSASTPDSDWRVKLQLAPGAKYLYANSTDSTDVLYPLHITKGIIFPYMPTIQVGYRAAYDSQELIHSNYKLHFYKDSSVDEVQISADFTAQDTVEAKYMLAVIHFFRSVTKMFYGQDTSPKAGTPPPLCFLSGLGHYQFNQHPLLITSFNYSLPNDVDYVRTEIGAAWKGYTIPNSPSTKSASLTQSILQKLRLSNSNLNAGGGTSAPVFKSLNDGTTQPTYVPTKIQIQFTALPVVSRKDISKNFSLQDFASGKLQNKGYW
jgi:hypothetical protein